MHSRAIEEAKRQLCLSQDQRQVLVGLLLGDGCLETQNEGRTYRLKIEQSVQHRAYVYHLYHLFEAWVLTPPRTRQVVSRGHASQNWVFQTVSHSAFRFYAHQFYQGGRKRVPKLIHRWLTSQALAYWFMDDGSIKSKESRGVILNTQDYDCSEVERLAQALQAVFDLQAWPRKQKEGYQLYISGACHERFIQLVTPYVIKEMRYKLPPARRNTFA